MMKQYPFAGFTLVSVLIGISVGLLVLSGLMTVFSNAKSAFEYTHQLQGIEENAAFALKHFSEHVVLAGYRPVPSANTAYPSLSSTFDASTSPYIGLNSGNLFVRYQGDGINVRDCRDQVVSLGNTVYVEYQLVSNTLQCVDNAAHTQIIARNIESVSYRFGKDTDGTTGTVDHYASTLSSGEQLKVMSVSMAIVARSQTALGRSDQNTYVLFGQPGNNYTIPNGYSRYMRHLFHTTVYLENTRLNR